MSFSTFFHSNQSTHKTHFTFIFELSLVSGIKFGQYFRWKDILSSQAKLVELDVFIA
jgi:hypothetical protein